MILTTLDGEDAYIWNHSPEWSTPFQLTLSLGSATARSLGGIEARRSRGAKLKASGQFAVKLLDEEEARQLRRTLLNLGDEPILFPLWPWDEMVADSDAAASFTECLMLTYEPDWSAYETHLLSVGPAGSYSGEARSVPVVVGYLSRQLRPNALTDEHLVIREVAFDESAADDYALEPVEPTLTDGPATPAGARPLFPLCPDWRDPEVGGVLVGIDRSAASESSRQSHATYFPQTPVRPGTFSCWFDGRAEWATLAGLLRLVKGNVETFWIPNRLTETPLSADAAAAATSITVEDPAMLQQGGQVIALIKNAEFGGTLTAIPLTNSLPLSNPLTFATPLATAYPAASTVVASLLLARLKIPSLTFYFGTDNQGRLTFEFAELPTEYADPDDEATGTTMGALPTDAILLDVVVEEDGVQTTYRFADFDTDVSVDGETYHGNRVAVAAITKSVNADSDSLSFSLTVPRGALAEPFASLFPYEIEGTVTLHARRAVLALDGRDHGLDYGPDYG